MPSRNTVGGTKYEITKEFTRPSDTNAYGANDVVSNSTSATTLQELANIATSEGGSGYIVGARLSTDKKSITPRMRVHLFNASNPTVSADNANHQDKYADHEKRLGYVDLPAMTTAADTSNSDMSRSFDLSTLRHAFKCAAGTSSIYYSLETLDAFSPASGQKFKLTLLVEAD